MTNVVIAGYARSPFTFARKGGLAEIRPDEIASQVVRGLIEGSGADSDDLEDVIIGCAFPEGEQGDNVARLVGFLSELPVTAAGTTVNRFCGSSMQSIHMAAGAIKMNAGDSFVCAGIESMSRVPMGGYNFMPHTGLAEHYPEAFVAMGITAENLAKKYKIEREEQQEFAVASHAKAHSAQTDGRLEDEIVPIVFGNIRVDADGCIRPGTNQEVLGSLEPAFDADGTVTAGTSSPLTDGGSSVLVCSEDYADEHGLDKMARIRGIGVSGCAPEIMGIGPVEASRKALERAGLVIDDIDVIELNEAFAAQSLAVIKEAGFDQEKVNLDGGAIAIGHPLGASGARITGKAASIMRREGKDLALATMCIGGGQGIATVLEAC